jgi:hypothetical protein
MKNQKYETWAKDQAAIKYECTEQNRCEMNGMSRVTKEVSSWTKLVWTEQRKGWINEKYLSTKHSNACRGKDNRLATRMVGR